MPKKCAKCGATVGDNSKFCINCGEKINSFEAPPNNEINNKAIEKQNQQMPPAQGYQNNQIPSQPAKKSNIKLIAILLAVIIAVVVIVAIVLVVFSGGVGFGSDESKFVGTWEWSISSYGYDLSYSFVFNSDKTLKLNMDMGGFGSPTSVNGNWKIENGKLVLSFSSSLSGGDTPAGTFDYSFSNGGSKLTLSQNGIDAMTLTKK